MPLLSKTLKSYFTPPTLWRYFLSQYLKVFGLSLFGFLTILLATRLEDFTRFISLGADLASTILYLFYQIPYVMQIALPISCLIGALYLFQNLSQSHSLTSLRASGISLFEIILPLLLFSVFLSFFTFYAVLNISAVSHRKAKELEFQMRSLNPLALMHNTKLLEEKGLNVDMKGSLARDGKAYDFVMAIRNGDNNKPALFIAKKMKVYDDHIKGSNLATICAFDPEVNTGFDHLIIENSKENQIRLTDLADAVNTKHLRLGNDDLKLGMLLAKREHLEKLISEKNNKYRQNLLARTDTEILRRLSLSLSLISFTLLGIAFGSTLGRVQTRTRLLYTLLLVAFFLTCFLGAKALATRVLPSAILYFLPHGVLIYASLRRLMRLQQGLTVS
jgi:lipopolysaccharide export system permease protein